MDNQCYDVGRWTQSLWAGHVRHRPDVQRLLATTPDAPALAHDVHGLLYLRHTPDVRPGAPAWAQTVLDEVQALPEWQQLRARCQANGFAAGLATESLLPAVLGLLPASPDAPQPDDQSDAQASTMRRALRQACRAASQAIDTGEAALAPLATVCGLQAGTGDGTPESLHGLDAVRALYALLRDNPTLRHIGQLAGRLHRLGHAEKKTHATPSVGSVQGLMLGGDVERLLPSELVGLRAPQRYTRLHTLARIQERRALQYQMRGPLPLSRGPMIVCLDISGSMGNDTDSAGTWGKAVAMALLLQATEQRRGFVGVPFNDRVRPGLHIAPGEPCTPEALGAFLGQRSRGSTDFDAPLCAALATLHTVPGMRQADIVFLTDGDADISPSVLAAVQAAQHTDDVHLYRVLIGKEAQHDNALGTISTASYRVSSTPGATDNTLVAPLLAEVGA